MKRLKAGSLKFLRWLFRQWPRPAGVRHILLDSRSTMTATYLEDLRELFNDDDRFRFFKTVRPNLPPSDARRALALVHCRQISYRLAKIIPWDLVVLADHPTDQIDDLFAQYGVLRISHGVGSKLVNGEDYYYGPGLYDRAGRLRYSCIFESSEKRRKQFAARNPQLAEVIALVGDLRIDKLRRVAEQAQKRPADLSRPSVVVAGSWSGGNIFEKLGPDLFAEAETLLDRYSFVIRPHPHVFNAGKVAHAGGASPGNWKAFFEEQQKRGFVLSIPTDDPSWLLAASSVVICDDLSSIALYAAVLGKRLIMVRSGSAQVDPDSFCGRLAQVVPNLNSPQELPTLLPAILAEEPPDAMAALAREINSRPGESAELIRDVVQRLLQLVPIGQPDSEIATVQRPSVRERDDISNSPLRTSRR